MAENESGATPRVAEQRREALSLAHIRRRQLKELRQAIKRGEVDVYDLLAGNLDPRVDKVVQEIKLATLLPMIPGIGKSSAMEIIFAFKANPSDRLGRFDAEGRRDLAYIVRGARDHRYTI